MISTRIILVAIITMMSLYLLWSLCRQILYPIIIRLGLREVSRNPIWVNNEIRTYYGFEDIDIVLCESLWGGLPHLRTSKDKTKLELWIPNDTPMDDINYYGRLALASKLKINYGLWFPEKSLPWLSIVCYMLDGGDVKYEFQSKSKQQTS